MLIIIYSEVLSKEKASFADGVWTSSVGFSVGLVPWGVRVSEPRCAPLV